MIKAAIEARRLFALVLFCLIAIGHDKQGRAEEDETSAPERAEAPSQLVQAVGGPKGLTGYEAPSRRAGVVRGQTVTSRPRPELDPLGANLGNGLRLVPSFTVTQFWDDNIFNDPDDEESDFITRAVPRLRLTSEWENHEVGLDAGAAIGRYWENTDENYEDFDFGARGRLDVQRSTSVSGRGRFERTHEDRGSSDDADGEEPTEVQIYDAGGEIDHRFGRIRGTLGGTFERLVFDDVDADNGTKIIEHDRDRNEVEGFLGLGYDINPGYEVFVRGAYNDVNYDGREVGTGIDRSNDGYSVVLGLDADFTGVVFGEFYVGYQDQSFDDAELDDVDGVVGGAAITWNVTELTTINFEGAADVRQTDVDGASGRLVASGGLQLDHELLRNLLLSARGGLTRDDFEGVDRTDYLYRAGFGVQYLWNRYMTVGAEYSLRIRDAEDSGDDYTENIVGLVARVQY